ncbi:MAG TPA: hypothetical protein VLD37_05180 [Candidatus Bilamarchaeum sp.]|nr:hypothetical protein [Candidatus Bilamarchaeum sp.]
MQSDGDTPSGEAGRAELFIEVDSGTIARLLISRRVRLRVLCNSRNFSLYLILHRKERQLESSEEENFEFRASGGDFGMLERPGTVVRFGSGGRDASFTVCCMHSLLPLFDIENPLVESMMRGISQKPAEWL